MAITAVSVLLVEPAYQVVCALMVLFVSTIAQAHSRPFKSAGVGFLEAVGLFANVVTMMCAALLLFEAATGKLLSVGADYAILFALVGLNGFVASLFVVFAVEAVRAIRRGYDHSFIRGLLKDRVVVNKLRATNRDNEDKALARRRRILQAHSSRSMRSTGSNLSIPSPRTANPVAASGVEVEMTSPRRPTSQPDTAGMPEVHADGDAVEHDAAVVHVEDAKSSAPPSKPGRAGMVPPPPPRPATSLSRRALGASVPPPPPKRSMRSLGGGKPGSAGSRSSRRSHTGGGLATARRASTTRGRASRSRGFQRRGRATMHVAPPPRGPVP